MIISSFEELVKKVERRSGALEAAKADLKTLEQNLNTAETAVVLHAGECDVLKLISDILRERIKERVEHLVTMGLRSVFERPDYRFELDMDLKRGQMTATPMLVSLFGDIEIKTPVMDSHGGGLVNVTAFILQAVVLALTKPKLAQVMMLDERFKNVSRNFLHNITELLKKLHEVTGIQFVLVTQRPELAQDADMIYEVDNVRGKTVVKAVDCLSEKMLKMLGVEKTTVQKIKELPGVTSGILRYRKENPKRKSYAQGRNRSMSKIH